MEKHSKKTLSEVVSQLGDKQFWVKAVHDTYHNSEKIKTCCNMMLVQKSFATEKLKIKYNTHDEFKLY